MLSREENELICGTGPGTPMGELFRRFWLPVALAEEIPGPDCDPIRVQVLGEHLVLFRDTQGCPGLVDAYCPHRGAPLFFGRNEEAGLRCVYHGWKFDVHGNCVDMPNLRSASLREAGEPAECDSRPAERNGTWVNGRVRAVAYPTVERNGIVWAFLGPRADLSGLPSLEWNL